MKNKSIAVSAVIAGCLLFSNMAAAGLDRTPQPQYVGPPFGSTPQPEYLSPQGEQVSTNVLLRQILAEVIKGNAQSADNRCSDGEKRYSPGYVISVGKKTLRCDTGNGYPEWVEDKA